jgi:hypothetical protein
MTGIRLGMGWHEVNMMIASPDKEAQDLCTARFSAGSTFRVKTPAATRDE